MNKISFTYRYIILLVLFFFAPVSLLLYFYGSWVWFAYLIPIIYTCFVLAYYANKVTFSQHQLIISNLWKKEHIDISEIRNFVVFKDPAMCGRTVGIDLFLKDGTIRKYHLATLLSSHLGSLHQMMEEQLK